MGKGFKILVETLLFSIIYAGIINYIFLHTTISKYSYIMFDFGVLVGIIGACFVDIIIKLNKGE